MSLGRFSCGVCCTVCLTGCTTSFMKSTPFYDGPQREYNVPAEERVNLWPLSYYRDPALSVLWPLSGFDLDAGSGWTLPAYWSKDGFTLFPICHFDAGDSAVFPLYYRDENRFLSLPWCGWESRCESGWAIPPLLTWGECGRTNADYQVCSLLGFAGAGRRGEDVRSWCAPLWFKDSRRFLSLLWCEQDDEDGRLRSWTVPPLLSGWKREKGVGKLTVLGGLGGWRSDSEGVQDSWCLPFYYAHRNGDVYTPLFGWSEKESSNWVFPMWYADERTILSFPWYSHRDEDGALDSWMIPPLLTYGQRSRDTGVFSTRPLLGLAGWDMKGDDCVSSWCFPLFGYEKGRSFFSLLYAEADDWWAIPPLLTWGEGADVRGRKIVHPLVFLGGLSMTTNGYESSWVFPLYYHDKDRFVSLLYGSTAKSNWLLPLWYRSSDSMLLAAGLFGVTPNSMWLTPAAIRTGDMWLFAFGLGGLIGRHGIDASWLAPLYWSDHGSGDFATIPFGSIGGFSWWLTPLFGFTDTTWWATPLVGRYERGNKVNNWVFPLVGWGEDATTDWSQTLFGLLWNSETNKKTGEVDKSILWRLWHYHEKDGDASMDIFPFITHDKKKNGYEKTSFLWKLYSRESDGKGQSHLDLLFIPVK